MAEVIRSNRDDHLGDLLLEVGFGEDVRYDHLKSRWLIWNGVRWRPDRERKVQDLVRDYAMKLWATADSRSDAGEFRKMLMPLFDTNKKENVLKGLSAREGIAMAGDEWDRDPYLLGFENGVLDLRTREFDPKPSPSTLVSKSVGYDWDPDAGCDLFKDFVVSIMSNDEELIRYLMGMLGYSLFGLTTEQKFWMWVGRGSNGKGVLARTITRALGDYADTPSDTMYMKTKFGSARSDAARPDLLRLQSVRFTPISEPPGGQFNEEMLKSHTGEDVILARNLYSKAEQMASFTPTHKIVFLTNDPPKTDDVGVSMRRRVRVIRFEEDFTGERADLTIEDRLKGEYPGIIALLTTFAYGWWNDGKPGLPEPAKVIEWSEEYLAENDPLSAFVVERCVVGHNEVGSSASLWGAYEDWCAARNQEAMSRTGFGLALGRRYKKAHGRDGNVWKGVRAKSAIELALEAPDD